MKPTVTISLEEYKKLNEIYENVIEGLNENTLQVEIDWAYITVVSNDEFVNDMALRLKLEQEQNRLLKAAIPERKLKRLFK